MAAVDEDVPFDVETDASGSYPKPSRASCCFLLEDTTRV